MLRTSSPILKPIREKVEAGERLSLDDGLCWTPRRAAA